MRLYDAIRWHGGDPCSRHLIVFVVVGAWVLLHTFIYCALSLRFPGSGQVDALIDEIPLWVALGAIVAVWSTLRVRLLVEDGTGAGFPVAVLGLVGRSRLVLFEGMSGPMDARDASAASAALPTLVSFHRDGGLVAYGLGLGLVVFASIADLRRRRSGPAWVFPRT